MVTAAEVVSLEKLICDSLYLFNQCVTHQSYINKYDLVCTRIFNSRFKYDIIV